MKYFYMAGCQERSDNELYAVGFVHADSTKEAMSKVISTVSHMGGAEQTPDTIDHEGGCLTYVDDGGRFVYVGTKSQVVLLDAKYRLKLEPEIK